MTKFTHLALKLKATGERGRGRDRAQGFANRARIGSTGAFVGSIVKDHQNTCWCLAKETSISKELVALQMVGVSDLSFNYVRTGGSSA